MDHDSLTDILQEGDVFACIAEDDNVEEVDYYLLRCSQPKCTLLEDTNDDFRLPWPHYSMVVYGRYYA